MEVETGTGTGGGDRGAGGSERAREEQRDSDGRVRASEETRRVAPRLVPTRAAPSVLAARAPHGVLRSGDERAGGAAAVSATPATGFSARFVGSFCHPRRQCVCRVHDGDARPTNGCMPRE